VFVVVVTTSATLVPSHTSNTACTLNDHVALYSIVWFGEQARLGGVVSTTVMVWLHVEVFVHWSVARHVRVALNVVPQKPVRLVVVVTTMVTLVPSHRSNTAGWANAQVIPHSTT